MSVRGSMWPMAGKLKTASQVLGCPKRITVNKNTVPEALNLGLMNGEYRIYKERYLNSGKALPLLRVMVDECTGVTSNPRYTTEKEQLVEPASAVD